MTPENAIEQKLYTQIGTCSKSQTVSGEFQLPGFQLDWSRYTPSQCPPARGIKGVMRTSL